MFSQDQGLFSKNPKSVEEKPLPGKHTGIICSLNSADRMAEHVDYQFAQDAAGTRPSPLRRTVEHAWAVKHSHAVYFRVSGPGGQNVPN